MDLATRKLHLMEQFMRIASVETVEKLELFFSKELQQNTDELPEMVVKLLEKSREDSKAGRVRPHSAVMKEVKEKYNIH